MEVKTGVPRDDNRRLELQSSELVGVLLPVESKKNKKKLDFTG